MVEGSATLKAGYQVVEGSVSAKYAEARNTSKNIKLVAPAGTNMEFTLQWTEQTWIGRVTAGGEPGNYTAHMPVSVEQVDAKNIGCSIVHTETPNWAISFEYRFPAGFWAAGTHEYTLGFNCPNIKDLDSNPFIGERTNSFIVSQDAGLLSGDVYFRGSGLWDGQIEGNFVDQIHPQQTTAAAWSLIEMTQPEAQLAPRDCIITITWDGGTPKQLTPGSPFQR